MICYRDGGCGPYEGRACNECPASKPSYNKDNIVKALSECSTDDNRLRNILAELDCDFNTPFNEVIKKISKLWRKK